MARSANQSKMYIKGKDEAVTAFKLVSQAQGIPAMERDTNDIDVTPIASPTRVVVRGRDLDGSLPIVIYDDPDDDGQKALRAAYETTRAVGGSDTTTTLTINFDFPTGKTEEFEATVIAFSTPEATNDSGLVRTVTINPLTEATEKDTPAAGTEGRAAAEGAGGQGGRTPTPPRSKGGAGGSSGDNS